MDLTYNCTAFWAAYINYESQYAEQSHIKLLGPLLAAANASLQNYAADSNLGDPIVAPFVTKAAQTLTVRPVLGLPGTISTTPVGNAKLWGDVYGQAHGGVCSSSAA